MSEDLDFGELIPSPSTFDGRGGSVYLREDGPDLVFEWSPESGATKRIVARYERKTGVLRTFPTDGASAEPQFSNVVEIQFDVACLPGWSEHDPIGENDWLGGALEMHGLPDGFGSIFLFGLGIRREYRSFMRLVEDHSPRTRVVRFGDSQHEGEVSGVLHLRLTRFTQYREAVDRNKRRGATVVARVNEAEAHNAVADLFGLDPVKPTVGRNNVIVAMTRELTDHKPLDDEDRRMLVSQVAIEAPQAAREEPVGFGKLRDDIQLVTLEVLIEQFEAELDGPGAKSEDRWQKFFQVNTFALQQLFPTPVVLFDPHVHVSRGNDRGEGARIADFVLANTVTRTAYVVEIKTPATKLLGGVYRGKGDAEVHPPSHELTGAVAQAQSQVESVREELPDLLRRRRDAKPLETYSVKVAVIAGKLGGLDEAQKASFGRYRDGLHDVEVLTFDEVLERLKNLHQVLTGVESVESDPY